MAGDEHINRWKGRGTVLVVDDDKSVCLVTKKMLESLGFVVLVAYDGAESIETFKSNQGEIVLVLLDITMPRMNGYDVFKMLRKINADVPVVLSSGHNERDVAQDFDSLKPDGFLQKPYFREQLRDKLYPLLMKSDVVE